MYGMTRGGRGRALAFAAMGIVTIATLLTGCSSMPGEGPGVNRGALPGSDAAFYHLSSQHTNYCSLDRSTVMSDPSGMRLQGACCNPMDRAKYRFQVAGLRAFISNSDIFHDPYDVPVSLAKRLLAYDTTLVLTPAQQAAYDRAISLTDDQGPCCCQCWRWYMTRGLAKSLISQHGGSPATVAKVIDLTNGCGGTLRA